MIRREIQYGTQLPKGYGVAWPVENRNTVACYPIPLNRVLHWSRRLLIWLRYPGALPSEFMLSEAYNRGWHAGYLVGVNVGESRERERIMEAS